MKNGAYSYGIFRLFHDWQVDTAIYSQPNSSGLGLCDRRLKPGQSGFDLPRVLVPNVVS
jgi:hypothetical protein